MADELNQSEIETVNIDAAAVMASMNEDENGADAVKCASKDADHAENASKDADHAENALKDADHAENTLKDADHDVNASKDASDVVEKRDNSKANNAEAADSDKVTDTGDDTAANATEDKADKDSVNEASDSADKASDSADKAAAASVAAPAAKVIPKHHFTIIDAFLGIGTLLFVFCCAGILMPNFSDEALIAGYILAFVFISGLFYATLHLQKVG